MKLSTKEITLIAIFPAMMAVTAGIAIPIGLGLPKITLQTLFVLLAGLVLSPKHSFYSMIVYVLLGIIGIPVFSGFLGGFGILLTASGGFIIGFIFVAPFVSFMKSVKFINNEYLHLFIVLLLGNIILYMFGGSYIVYLSDGNLWLTLKAFAIYYPGDIIKIIVALYVYVRIRSHITYEQA